MRGNRDPDLNPIIYTLIFRKRSTNRKVPRHNPLKKGSLRKIQDLLVNQFHTHRDALVNQFHTLRDALSSKLNVNININIIIIFLCIIIMMVNTLHMITIHLTFHITCIINMHTFIHKHNIDLFILEMDTRFSTKCADLDQFTEPIQFQELKRLEELNSKDLRGKRNSNRFICLRVLLDQLQCMNLLKDTMQFPIFMESMKPTLSL